MMMFTTHQLLQHDAIAHGFFGREGGVSEGIYRGLNCGPGSGDKPEHIAENRRRVEMALGGKLCTLYQIHSSTVVVIPTLGDTVDRPQADAMVSNRPGILLGILTADCAPVLLADPYAKVIGAAHAGWKGAQGGVIGNTVRAMQELGANREHISAVVGPCIAQASYEVGPEFAARFAVEDQQQFFMASKREDHGMFDLSGFVLAQLARAGITKAAALNLDTCADEANYFSYRRTTLRGEPDYGRQVSVIGLKE
jgi:YfiH family protein